MSRSYKGLILSAFTENTGVSYHKIVLQTSCTCFCVQVQQPQHCVELWEHASRLCEGCIPGKVSLQHLPPVGLRKNVLYHRAWMTPRQGRYLLV